MVEIVRYRLARIHRFVGWGLAVWCGAFGVVHLIWPRSFSFTVTPARSGFESPDGSVALYGVVFGVYILMAAGLIAQLSDGRPSVVVGRRSGMKRASLLLLSVASLTRAGLGIPGIVEGDLAVATILAEVWFTIAGSAGVLLWLILLRRKHSIESCTLDSI